MSQGSHKAFTCVLQESISLDDSEWTYHVPHLSHQPPTDLRQRIKSIVFISNSLKQQTLLRLEVIGPNRAIVADPLDRFILVSFADFRIRAEQLLLAGNNNVAETRRSTARENSEYIAKVLRSGITLNSIHYNFYGHSNSQLKSRTCFLYAGSKQKIETKINSLGDFTKMKTVAKKSKRIGLLFSVAEMATTVDPDRCQDIPDVERDGYVFTDGCGLISRHLAHELVRKVHIAFRNVKYTPSVFQIRYRGYKGVLTVDVNLNGKILVKCRKSMKKFSGGNDFSFSVVDYSKPYKYGYLNDEVVLLLHTLGITESTILRKQGEYLQYLEETTQNPRTAFRFLTYINRLDLAERVLIDSLESVRLTISKLVNAEYSKMLNKKDEQRCRILIPNSRLLFGVCDAWDVLKEGECAVKVTMDGDGQPRALTGMEILVTRNPCLHPGDLQKFKVVAKEELAHLVDCIVFSTRGKRPSADLMSGGDLDGDTFFVCWDRDLIPEKLSEPAHYPAGKEPVSFRQITDDDRLEYFAKYTNASLGKVKNLFLDWARIKGPMSAECQELNRLFSMSVDSNRIKIPEKLESAPTPTSDSLPFILDVLHDAARATIQARQNSIRTFEGCDFDAMELLLARDEIAISEFELIKITHRWCRKTRITFDDFFHFFDMNLLSVEEKMWILSYLPPSKQIPSLVLNALCSSNLIQTTELRQFKLDYPGLKWKCIYDSSRDRLATFLDATTRALELFHRKLIVIRVDKRLTIAIYVPEKVERGKERQVDNRVRLFAFPHTQGEETSQRLALPTKMNYRLYCDNNVFQLFENTRGNSWIFFTRGASDDSSYRGNKNVGDKRRARQATVDSCQNFDCRASFALQKFSKDLKNHVGEVKRSGVCGAEIYVISNRDLKTMQNLDLWLDFVDTREIIPLFERNAKEYIIPKLTDVDWSKEADFLVQIVRKQRYSTFNTLESRKNYEAVFDFLLEKNERGELFKVFKYILGELVDSTTHLTNPSMTIQALLDFLNRAPFLSITLAQTAPWITFPPEVSEVLEKSAGIVLQAFVLSANEMQEFVVEPFKKVLSLTQHMSLSDFAQLIELISLTVRSPEIALDLLLEGLEPESMRLLKGPSAIVQYFIWNLIGIALDHIDEASQALSSKGQLLDLKFHQKSSGSYPIVVAQLRIDAPTGALATADHVRLIAASAPANSTSSSKYSMDALVENSQPGQATFRCFQPPPPFLEQCSWKLEKCGSFVTTKTMFDSVHALITQKLGCCGITDHILEPQGYSANRNTKTRAVYVTKAKLNASQNAAVEASLTHLLTCLWGPPGTGKTHTTVEIIEELQLSNPERRILVTAPTHNAVDNVMRKYMENSMTVEGYPSKTLPIRVSTDVRKVSEDLRKYTCDAMAGKEIYTNHATLKKAQNQIKKCNLVFTTCIGAGLGLLRSEIFDTVIIDEASQITEPASLVPLVKGCQKAILVGDHVQLGPTVQQHALLVQFDVSLFERLYKQQTSSSTDNNMISNGIAKIMLDTQYRMHKSICRFSSAEFYDSKLLTGIPDNARPVPASEFPWPYTFDAKSAQLTSASKDYARMLFVECPTPEDFGQKSKSNEGQAKLCREICRKLCTATENAKSGSPSVEKQLIAVLTPYSRQVDLLKKHLSEFAAVEVSSIDGFQGREADIVVFVTVRCNVHCEIGFLKDLRRLNVALTRARAAVIIIGHRQTLSVGSDDPESKIVWTRLLKQLVEVKL